MALVHRINSSLSSQSVIWASDPDTSNPWNFDSFPAGPTSAYSAQISNDADYGGNLIEMTMIGAGQQPAHPPTLNDAGRGGSILDAMSAGTGDFYFRLLMKYSLSDSYDHWNEGTPASGFGWEYKFFDIGDEMAGGRVIIKHKSWGDESHGHIFTTINGSSGEANKAWGENLGQMFVSNTLYYILIGILANGTLLGWYAPYDGTNTEYSEGSPDLTLTNHHTWTPSTAVDRTFDFFRNHTAHDSGEVIRFHLAMNDSFIGPGAVTSIL